MKFFKPIEVEEFNEDDLRKTLAGMVELGLIKISGYTDSFEPRYSITPLGKLDLDMYAAD